MAINTSSKSIFQGTVTPDTTITQYTLFRGVTDFSNLAQFKNFESGYSFLIVLSIPKFLENLCNISSSGESNGYKDLIDTYKHILEYEFKGISGFEDIQSETSTVSNGVSELGLITKVTRQGNSQFSMRYYERSGLVLEKVNELFLRGIKDPKTQVKTYNGLIDGTANGMKAGYENEVFQFLYFVTDNTCRQIEKAYLIVSAQPTTAALSEVSNSERGQIEWKEVDMQFNGFPIDGPAITKKAQEFLDWINENTIFEESKFGYKAISEMKSPNDNSFKVVKSPEATW